MRVLLRKLRLIIGVWLVVATVTASDWTELRGPNRDGASADKNLPEKWSPGGENLLWRAPFGGTSVPVALGDRVYLQNTVGQGATMQDRVVCIDANTGKVVWEKQVPLNPSELPPQRTASPTPAIDPETGFVFVVTPGGKLAAYTRDGMPLWMRSLTEEFGFQGSQRIVSPVVDESTVIVSGITFNWGDQAGGAHRFIAFDKRTGDSLWVSSPEKKLYDANDSPPMITEVGGIRLFVTGGSDGAWHALKVATGESVWRYEVSKRPVNSGAIRFGQDLILVHGEENLDGNTMGLMAALNPSVTGEVTRSQTKWIRTGFRSMSAPVSDGQRIYMVDNTATLAAFNANGGDQLWTLKLGAGPKAAPVVADDKIYIGGEDGKFYIVKPRVDGADILSEVSLGRSGKPERISASAAVSNGRIYLATSDALYAIGKAGNKVAAWRPVTPVSQERTPAYVQVTPADIAVNSGQMTRFHVKLLDNKGNFLREVTPPLQTGLDPPVLARQPQPAPQGQRGQQRPSEMQWSLEQVSGVVQPDGAYTAPTDGKAYAGKIRVKVGNLTGEARVRVIPPVWETTFDDVEVGSVPAWWLNARSKFVVKMIEGNRVLAKLADDTSPAMRRARTFAGLRTMTNYTVQADVRFASGSSSLGDGGILAQGYELVLAGGQRLELRSPRADANGATTKAIKIVADEWQRLKLEVQIQMDGSVHARGKAWLASQPEPQNWTIERTDKPELAVPTGSPGLYADASAEVYFDNLKVTPNR